MHKGTSEPKQRNPEIHSRSWFRAFFTANHGVLDTWGWRYHIPRRGTWPDIWAWDFPGSRNQDATTPSAHKSPMSPSCTAVGMGFSHEHRGRTAHRQRDGWIARQKWQLRHQVWLKTQWVKWGKSRKSKKEGFKPRPVQPRGGGSHVQTLHQWMESLFIIQGAHIPTTASAWPPGPCIGNPVWASLLHGSELDMLVAVVLLFVFISLGHGPGPWSPWMFWRGWGLSIFSSLYQYLPLSGHPLESWGLSVWLRQLMPMTQGHVENFRSLPDG